MLFLKVLVLFLEKFENISKGFDNIFKFLIVLLNEMFWLSQKIISGMKLEIFIKKYCILEQFFWKLAELLCLN